MVDCDGRAWELLERAARYRKDIRSWDMVAGRRQLGWAVEVEVVPGCASPACAGCASGVGVEALVAAAVAALSTSLIASTEAFLMVTVAKHLGGLPKSGSALVVPTCSHKVIAQTAVAHWFAAHMAASGSA
jgi:hypothetical protein